MTAARTSPSVAAPPTGAANRLPQIPEAVHSRALRWLPLAVCFAIAGLSLLIADRPTYDPWSWLVWARELSGQSLVSFDSSGASGWKPLPVIVMIPFNWFGPQVAPIAWVWITRTAMLMIPVVSWRLGRRSAGYPGAALAAAGSLLVPGASVYLGGLTEPISALALLILVEQYIKDRFRLAWAAGLISALGRPETMAFVGPFGLWLSVRRKMQGYWFLLGLVAASLLWAGGDWIGTGKPLGLLGKADKSTEPLRIQAFAHPGWEVLSGQVISWAVAAVALAAFIAAWKWRDDISRLLGLIVLATALSIGIATEFGYPGVTRYVVPVVPAMYALAGIGAGRLIALIKPDPAKWVATVAAGALLLVAAAPLAIERDKADWHWYSSRESDLADLPHVIDAAGGRGWIVTCGGLVAEPSGLVSGAAYAADIQLKKFGRNGIADISPATSPSVALVTRDRYAALLAAARQQSLRTATMGGSRHWLAVWVGQPGQKPCVDPLATGR